MADTTSRGSTQKRGGLAGCVLGIVPFVVGLVLALAVGWLVFPLVMFSEREQPIRFSHKVHAEEQGMACADCHTVRSDGTFAGLPTLESCAMCHESAVGEDPEEARFIAEYVEQGKEVPWLVYQKQPDNVFFSHAAHSLQNCATCHQDTYATENDLCVICHVDVASSDSAPVYKENRLTGYSASTMKMWQCESCHALHMETGQTTASNACFVCHK